MREVIECTVDSVRMHGTLHRPETESSDQPPRLAVLVLNPGHVARSGAGDLVAIVSDELAQRGYPVYRYDLCGLGDTRGELPRWETEYFRFIQEGGHTDLAIGLLEEVKLRSGAQGIAMSGLCGGAITAMFAADRTSVGVEGVVMLDTDFSLLSKASDDEKNPNSQSTGFLTRVWRIFRKLRNRQAWIRFSTGENRFRTVLRPFAWLLAPIGKLLMGSRLPSDANHALIDASGRVVKRGTQVLSVTAADKLRELYVRQVEPVAFGPKEMTNVRRISIRNTNHVFTAGGAKQRVITEICDWIDAHWSEV